MTDNEIIKAFTICANQGACKDCPLDDSGGVERCMHTLLLNALDLINRQQAEIERLNNGLAISKKETKRYFQSYATAKSEARKEFAERLKETASYKQYKFFVTKEDIDNLLKEMG